MTKIPCFQVDAFTNKPFTGNPAAVCLLDQEHDAAWMQAVAAEMNLAETAFVRPLGDDWELRWFTPAVEVDLCGHATLAAANILWQEQFIPSNKEIRFSTRSGILTCKRDGQLIGMDFPATPATECEEPAGLLEALGVHPVWLGGSLYDVLVLVESEAVVQGLQPDFRQLAQVPTRGIIVTALADNREYHFVSRFFAPSVGIDEDPVTGSAHCCLGPFWGEKLNLKTLVARQISPRGGTVRLSLNDDRVLLGGESVLIWKGELWV